MGYWQVSIAISVLLIALYFIYIKPTGGNIKSKTVKNLSTGKGIAILPFSDCSNNDNSHPYGNLPVDFEGYVYDKYESVFTFGWQKT